jgi:DNA-binding transcriptional LysR family regulator
MHWDDLRHVLALARHHTLSKSAATLGATHTTVARRLQALEAALGSRLFDQTPEGYVPTAAGQHVIELAERMESEVLAMEARVQGGDARLHGTLRVSTMDILFRQHHRALASFIERYPDIELTVGCSDSEVSLTRREADVAWRMTNTPPEGLVGRKVGRVDFAVYASKRLVKRVGAKAPLSAYPWLHWDERLNPRWLEQVLAEVAPGARVALRVDLSSLALREAVSAGLGVHFLACFEGDNDSTLQRISPVFEPVSRAVWLLTLPELRSNTRVRAFMDHMAEALTAA